MPEDAATGWTMRMYFLTLLSREGQAKSRRLSVVLRSRSSSRWP